MFRVKDELIAEEEGRDSHAFLFLMYHYSRITASVHAALHHPVEYF